MHVQNGLSMYLVTTSLLRYTAMSSNHGCFGCFICTPPREHGGIIVVVVEEEEHLTLYSTHGESRIFCVYYKIAGLRDMRDTTSNDQGQ